MPKLMFWTANQTEACVHTSQSHGERLFNNTCVFKSAEFTDVWLFLCHQNHFSTAETLAAVLHMLHECFWVTVVTTSDLQGFHSDVCDVSYAVSWCCGFRFDFWVPVFVLKVLWYFNVVMIYCHISKPKTIIVLWVKIINYLTLGLQIPHENAWIDKNEDLIKQI